MGVTIAVGANIGSLFFFEQVVRRNWDDHGLMIGYTIASMFFFYLLYLNTSKHIYGMIDNRNQSFVYGNLVFQQEVDIKDVRIIRRKVWPMSTYLISIGRSRYLIYSTKDIRGYFTLKS